MKLPSKTKDHVGEVQIIILKFKLHVITGFLLLISAFPAFANGFELMFHPSLNLFIPLAEKIEADQGYGEFRTRSTLLSVNEIQRIARQVSHTVVDENSDFETWYLKLNSMTVSSGDEFSLEEKKSAKTVFSAAKKLASALAMKIAPKEQMELLYQFNFGSFEVKEKILKALSLTLIEEELDKLEAITSKRIGFLNFRFLSGTFGVLDLSMLLTGITQAVSDIGVITRNFGASMVGLNAFLLAVELIISNTDLLTAKDFPFGTKELEKEELAQARIAFNRVIERFEAGLQIQNKDLAKGLKVNLHDFDKKEFNGFLTNPDVQTFRLMTLFSSILSVVSAFHGSDQVSLFISTFTAVVALIGHNLIIDGEKGNTFGTIADRSGLFGTKFFGNRLRNLDYGLLRKMSRTWRRELGNTVLNGP